MVEIIDNNIHKIKCIQIIIQEPYASFNFINNELQIPSVPRTYCVHQNLDNKDHAYGAIILTKRSLLAEIVPNPISNECIGIKIAFKILIYIYSVYCRPSNSNLNIVMEKFNKFKYLNSTLIGMDAFAKNKLWGSNRTDNKGLELENFITMNNLKVVNVKIKKLDYIPLRTGKVDVTLFGDKLNVLDGKILDMVSLSDHPYIFYELEVGRTGKRPTEHST